MDAPSWTRSQPHFLSPLFLTHISPQLPQAGGSARNRDQAGRKERGGSASREDDSTSVQPQQENAPETAAREE